MFSCKKIFINIQISTLYW